jgi:hypothetical protein
LLLVSIACVAAWWQAERWWLTVHRRAWLGTAYNSDAGPEPWLVPASAALVVLGVGLAAVLVLARRCAPGARPIAGGLLAVGLLGSGASAVGSGSGDRCSLDHYSGFTTCVSAGHARAVDVLTILVPGVLAVAALAAGERRERRRAGSAADGPGAGGRDVRGGQGVRSRTQASNAGRSPSRTSGPAHSMAATPT